MTAKRYISPSRRRWLDEQRARALAEAKRRGFEVETDRSTWAYSTRSDPEHQ